MKRSRLSQLLGRLEGLGLVVSSVAAGRRRLALADRGLALLARRDRAAVGVARKQLERRPLDPRGPPHMAQRVGREEQTTAAAHQHTRAVHGFVAALAGQARAQGWEIVQLDPPHRASRYFRYSDRLHSVHPDAFGILRRNKRTWSFFLEWERRAVRPVTMAARLAPYLRYYASHRPTDDHGTLPLVLVVFDSDIVQTHFLRVAREAMARTRATVPLWVSHRSACGDGGAARSSVAHSRMARDPAYASKWQQRSKSWEIRRRPIASIPARSP